MNTVIQTSKHANGGPPVLLKLFTTPSDEENRKVSVLFGVTCAVQPPVLLFDLTSERGFYFAKVP